MACTNTFFDCRLLMPRKRWLERKLIVCLWLWLCFSIVLFTMAKYKRNRERLLAMERQTVPETVKIQGECFDPDALKRSVKEFQEQEQAKRNVMYRKRAKHFNSPIEVDTSEDKKKCPAFYEIAEKMLDGLKIKLPSETNNTRWKFRERLDLNILKTTKLRWNAPWEQGNSQQTKEYFKRYNVSATSIKNRKILITYGHNCCRSSKARAVKTAIDNAKMDYAEALDLSALSVPFQIAHGERLRNRKGAGYWLWKPYVILKTMLYKMNDGDILIFQDSGMYFVKDVGPLLKVCKDSKPSVLTFTTNYEEAKYSKRDAFVLMDMDDPVVYAQGEEQSQRISGVMVVMKNCETIQFYMELLAYTMDDRITNDKANVMGKPNLPNFIANRHDQTALSLLSKKWGILSVRDPCSSCDKSGNFKRHHGYASGPVKELYIRNRDRS